MGMLQYIDASEFKTQPFVPSEEEASHANEQALDQGISRDICVAIVASQSSTEPVIIPTEDPTVSFTAQMPEDGIPAIRPLQLQESGEVLIAAPLRLCEKMGASLVSVILPANEEQACAVRKAVDRTSSSLESMECECLSLREVAGNVEVFGFDASMLSALLDAAKAQKAQFVLVLDACAPRIQPRHLLQLFTDARKNPESDVVTSWSGWARQFPFLFSVEFLKRLHAAGWSYASPTSCTPPTVPLLGAHVKDSVFGEERLDVSTAIPAAFASFEQEATISALEAVALSRESALLESDEERDELFETLTDADKLLVKTARRVCGFVDDLMRESQGKASKPGQEDFASELAWATEWGARNKIDFPLFAQEKYCHSLAYLDTAATSQRCYQAIHAEQQFEQNENANVYRGSYNLSMQATFHMNDARAVIEAWINADRRQTVLTANATASLNLVAQAWGERNIGEGDLIVVPACEHHSNLLPWMLLANRKHARLGYITPLPNGELDLSEYRKLLKQKPKLVCVAHIGNVLGIVNPVKEMAQEAHEAGARFVLDAAQSFPHMRLDVKDLGVDFVAFSAHKAYGPNGIGGLWISPEAAAEMEPLAGGGGTVSHVDLTSYYWRAGAIQYELGTPQLSQLFGFAAAVEYMNALGMSRIERHSKVLTQLLMGLCERLGFVHVWGRHDTEESQTGLVSMSIAGIDSSIAGALLGKMGVAVRSGAHCAHPLAAFMGLSGTVRMSFGVYNTPDDIIAACVALIVAHDLGQPEK